MNDGRKMTLVVGATGSIGRHVVQVAIEKGHQVRALVRNNAKASVFPRQVEVVIGDVTRIETLVPAVSGIDAVVLTLGSDGMGKTGAETVDYGGVRNDLQAISSREQIHVALMTSIGVTNRASAYNRSTESHDWKRRAERIVRASGLPYTIVRPGWFDYNRPDETKLVFLQGDERQSGTPKDGVIARRQIAEVLVASISSTSAIRKTFELVAAQGHSQQDLEPLFAALVPDLEGAIDAMRDPRNQPIKDEPDRVREDLQATFRKSWDDVRGARERAVTQGELQ